MLSLSLATNAILAILCTIAFMRAKTLKSSLQNTQDLLATSTKESQHLAQEKAHFQATLQSTQHFHTQALDEKTAQIKELKQTHKIELENLQKQAQESLKTLKNELEKNLEKNIEIQKTALLNQNKIALNKDSREILEEIFTPIKKEIEDYSKTLLQNEANLKANISHIFEYSRKLGEDANRLAQVLQGDKKVRGNFGELQLKAVLESSGLQEGVNYEIQSGFSEEGKRYIPDAVVYFDKDKGIIIDSKFSLPNLPDFDSYANDLGANNMGYEDLGDLSDLGYDSGGGANPTKKAEKNSQNLTQNPNNADFSNDYLSQNSQNQNPHKNSDSSKNDNAIIINPLLQAQIAKNLKSRIDELAKKPYKKFKSANPAFAKAQISDFILLFVPYNNILDLALNADPNIYQYAYKREIYLTTPHTLFMALKTISISWVHIQSDENVKKAFEEIGRFYDKFVAVCEDFEKLKSLLSQAQKRSDDMDTKLSGRGGIASKFELLKELGAKTKKSLAKIQESSEAQDGGQKEDLDKLDKTKIIDNDEKWALVESMDSNERAEIDDNKDIPQI